MAGRLRESKTDPRLRECGPTLVVAFGVDAALSLLARVELAAGVRIAVVVQPARAHLKEGFEVETD